MRIDIQGLVAVDKDKDGFYLVAEAPDGRVFAHDHRFAGEDLAYGFAYIVRAKGSIDQAHWDCFRVVYGSVAYQVGGYEAAQLADERSQG